MIEIVAEHIGELREIFVFLGGASTCLLVTDPAAPEVRPTKDVDVIVAVTSRREYHKLEDKLRQMGFKQSAEPEDPLCRWVIGSVKVDVMPTDETILGFSGRWYAEAIENSEEFKIAENLKIRLVSVPYFLATKIEAFYGRGKTDYLASSDMEDIVTVLDGRENIINEIAASQPEIKEYLSAQFKKFVSNDMFLESLPGHLPPDQASQARLPILLEKIKQITEVV